MSPTTCALELVLQEGGQRSSGLSLACFLLFTLQWHLKWGAPFYPPSTCSGTYLRTLLMGVLCQESIFCSCSLPILLCSTVWCQVAVLSGFCVSPVVFQCAMMATAKAFGSSHHCRDQSIVFKPAAPGLVKVVVATNIAETGITVPDITTVIDSGRVKEVRYVTQRAPGPGH